MPLLLYDTELLWIYVGVSVHVGLLQSSMHHPQYPQMPLSPLSDYLCMPVILWTSLDFPGDSGMSEVTPLSAVTLSVHGNVGYNTSHLVLLEVVQFYFCRYLY